MDLNTSYVEVKHITAQRSKAIMDYLNTSYVEVKR